MFTSKTKKSIPKIPTKARLLNIAMYYLERFESSSENLKTVLYRRIDKYAFINKDYDKSEAYLLVEEIIKECVDKNFVNDTRFTQLKVKNYLNKGKSKNYIKTHLKQKGIDDKTIAKTLEENQYDELEIATKFASKKKIGKFRIDEEDRIKNKQKDLATIIRAGFSYDVANTLLDD